MKEIQLTKGKLALIDDDDFERVNQWKWTWMPGKNSGKNSLGYAFRNMRIEGKQTCILLHRFIMNAPKDFEVDHWDNDGLNCQKKNLRICSKGQNQHNQKARKGGSSDFKGVSFYKANGKFGAYITLNGKLKFLGYFVEETEAAKAYDKAASDLFGESAQLNFNS